MIPQTIHWRRSVPGSVLRLVHDRNPFFLLSALSMFVGFRVVLAAVNATPGAWRPLLGLIVTMQAYEVGLIGLALFLIVRRGLERDGWILLGIDALFLVDLTNLNAELFTALPRLGAVVNGLCLLLAVGKVAVVVRTLRLRLTRGTALYAAAQLAFLLALPGTFRLLRSSTAAVSAMDVYAVWWAAGLLLAAGAAVVRRNPRDAGNPMAALPGRLYVALPLVSLLVHLASENRVFWVHFQPANVAPILLAAVVAVHRTLPRRSQLRWSLGLVATAALISVVPGEYGPDMTGRLLGLTVTPFRLAVAAGGGTVAALAVYHRSWAAGVAVAAAGGAATLGSSPAEIARRLSRAAAWASDEAARLVPDTDLGWGYTAIVAAFLLLGLGAVFSLRGPPRPAVPPPVSGG